MQTTTMLLWKNNTVIEAGIAKLKQFDTNPNIGIQLGIAGVPYSLVGCLITARVKFTFKLQQALAIGAKIAKTSIDTKLKVNDIIRVDNEEVKVTSIDASSDPGFYRLKLLRAQNGTTEENHANGSDLDVTIVERSGKVANTTNQDIAFFSWETGDTNRVGTFEIEFEISEPTGEKFSVPDSAIYITISQDFNRS